MQRYRDSAGNSGISGYEVGPSSITVEFKDGHTYLYTYTVPGREEVEAMKQLAIAGDGLNTYINKHVRERYARRLR